MRNSYTSTIPSHTRSAVRFNQVAVQIPVWCIVVAVLFSGTTHAQSRGPEAGSLLLAGGGIRDAAIFERFIALAGGDQAVLVVIPTAGGAQAYDQDCSCADPFRKLGVKDVTVLHTYDPTEADSDLFIRPISRATGVWFSGGRQWRLMDAYAGTKALGAFRGVLTRGGAIGGSSAGATIQGSYLARGDSRTNTIMMGDHEAGFGFLSGVAVDQHVLKRNRPFDMLEIVEAHPDLLGIGLDEDTAIVVHGTSFEVIGNSYVLIYDSKNSLGSDAPFYFLTAGDSFDLVSRLPIGDDVRGLQNRLQRSNETRQ